MSLAAFSSTPSPSAPAQAPDLVTPPPSLLARLLQSRLAGERSSQRVWPLPAGVTADLRPALPAIAKAALMLYAKRQHVESFPLLYTTLALAHPN